MNDPERVDRRLRLTARELGGQLIILAVILWVAAGVKAVAPAWYLKDPQIKDTDFVHFYTLARLGAAGRADKFADQAVQHTVQISVHPNSWGYWFPPSYGPQMALMLAPLGHLAYPWAFAVWAIVTAIGTLALVALVASRTDRVRQHDRLVLLAAVAFPPFWYVLQYGQLSVIAVATVVAAWLALRRGKAAWAGAALGILAYKPSLYVPVLAVLLLAGAWRILGAALVTGVGQIVAATWWVGPGSLGLYGHMLVIRLRQPVIGMEILPQMHSWRAFSLLLIPHPQLALAVYVVTAGMTILAAAHLWRTIADPSLRMSSLVLATVLAAPHLNVYDLLVLAPVWIWLTDWYLSRPTIPGAVGRTLYVGYVAGLPVTALVLHVQVSTLCFAALLFWIGRYHGAPLRPEVNQTPATTLLWTDDFSNTKEKPDAIGLQPKA
jgi:alpha-1,2-mannosyltransferase